MVYGLAWNPVQVWRIPSRLCMRSLDAEDLVRRELFCSDFGRLTLRHNGLLVVSNELRLVRQSCSLWQIFQFRLDWKENSKLQVSASRFASSSCTARNLGPRDSAAFIRASSQSVVRARRSSSYPISLTDNLNQFSENSGEFINMLQLSLSLSLPQISLVKWREPLWLLDVTGCNLQPHDHRHRSSR